MKPLVPSDTSLVADIRQLIDGGRQRAAVAVDAELTLRYWQVGQCIHPEILGSQRADYGEAIVAALSRQPTAGYGRGWSVRQLQKRMQSMRFERSAISKQLEATIQHDLKVLRREDKPSRVAAERPLPDRAAAARNLAGQELHDSIEWARARLLEVIRED